MPPDLVSRDVHRLLLSDAEVAFTLVRRRGRRGVALRVDHGGLTVSAPLGMPLARVEGLVRESERWVLRKLEEWSARRIPRVEWSDGASLPYLGGSLRLTLSAGPRNRAVLFGDALHVQARDLSPAAVRRAVVAWYKRAALAHLAGRAFALARIAGLTPPRVLLSSAMARWGSCNARREVRLAWRLVKAPPALIDYVVCHELAHLRHMNHSRAFWAEVERQCPDYRRLRKALLDSDHLYRSF
jgi:predicted metal-dependent hydrolase